MNNEALRQRFLKALDDPDSKTKIGQALMAEIRRDRLLLPPIREIPDRVVQTESGSEPGSVPRA